MSRKNKKELYVIKNNRIYSGKRKSESKNKKGYYYLTIISTGERIVTNKNNIFNSFDKAEEALDIRKIYSQRYLNKKIKRKRIKNRILDLEDSMIWIIKSQFKNKITHEEADKIIKENTKKIIKLKRILSKYNNIKK